MPDTLSTKPATAKPEHSELTESQVMRCSELDTHCLVDFVGLLGLTLSQVADGHAIPGSHWGDDEAGLIRNTLYVRSDTPVHSALHETCHWLLMDQGRRNNLHTDAGGTQTEENAVCFLQIMLADYVTGMSRARMCLDMDRWGYSFRLGSAAKWFAVDASDAFAFLQLHGWIAVDAVYEDAARVKPQLIPASFQHRDNRRD